MPQADSRRPIDLTGTWQGAYRQVLHMVDGKPQESVCEILAHLRSIGTELHGTITELQAVRESRWADTFALHKPQLSWYERKQGEDFLRQHPETVYSVRLCEESAVRGDVQGLTVQFARFYSGPCDYAYCYDGFETITRIFDQTVDYSGTYNESTASISGRFLVRPTRAPEVRNHADGTFSLTKLQD